MKICYVHQYFKLPTQAGSHRSYYFAKALAQQGNEVVVITAHSEKKIHFLEIEGFLVIFLPVPYSQKFCFWQRIFAFVKFVFLALKTFHKHSKHVKCLYATSTPLSVGAIALVIRVLYKIPYFFEVRDLWPEVPIQMGIIKNFMTKKLLYFFEKAIYKKSSKIIALSEDIKHYILKKVPLKEVICIPNIADEEIFAHNSQKTELASVKKLLENTQITLPNDSFLVLYAGSMGKANGLDFMLETALLLQKQPLDDALRKIFFLLVGEGSEKQHLQRKVQENHLANIGFLEVQNKHQVSDLLVFADAFLVCFADYEALFTGSPNKFFDGLAVGRLCIHNTSGWIKRLVETKKCGVFVQTPSAFLDDIKPYLTNPEKLKREQHNAFLLATNEFSKKILTERFLSLFKEF